MRIISAVFMLMLFAAVCCGQDEPKVCVSQDAANKCVKAAAELIEARNVISEFQKERAASIAEREKAGVVIAGLNELVVVKDRIIASYEQINALYKSVIELQQGIILKLEERLMKPKSAFSKFLDALKTVAYFLAGAALGRGL